MMQKVFFCSVTVTAPVKDMNAREYIMMAALTIGIVVLGLFPQPVMDMVKRLAE